MIQETENRKIARWRVQIYCTDDKIPGAVYIANAKADSNKKIADKRKKRTDATQKLQKEEVVEAKKIEQSQKAIYSGYERRITEITIYRNKYRLEKSNDYRRNPQQDR